MPWDTPNRIHMWGWAPVPAKLLPGRLQFITRNMTAAYLVEYRTGFPFSVVDQQGFLIGSPNGARYPDYFSINLHLERQFRAIHYLWAWRFGMDNLTNNGNPNSVNNVIGTPQFRTYGRGQARAFSVRLRFLGRHKWRTGQVSHLPRTQLIVNSDNSTRRSEMRGLAIVTASLLASTGLIAAKERRIGLRDQPRCSQKSWPLRIKGFPRICLAKAQCVIIVPGVKKAAFVVGGEYGRGFADLPQEFGRGLGRAGRGPHGRRQLRVRRLADRPPISSCW